MLFRSSRYLQSGLCTVDWYILCGAEAFETLEVVVLNKKHFLKVLFFVLFLPFFPLLVRMIIKDSLFIGFVLIESKLRNQPFCF